MQELLVPRDISNFGYDDRLLNAHEVVALFVLGRRFKNRHFVVARVVILQCGVRVYLFLEQFVEPRLVDFALLLGCHALASDELVVSVDTFVFQNLDHVPSRKSAEVFVGVPHLDQLLLNLDFCQSPQISISACDGFRVLHRWVQRDSAVLGLRVSFAGFKRHPEERNSAMALARIANALQEHHLLGLLAD